MTERSHHKMHCANAEEAASRLVFVLATSTCEDLALLSHTPASVTEFDGYVSHRVDTGNSSLDRRPTVRTGIDWIAHLTILSQQGAAFLCSDERAW